MVARRPLRLTEDDLKQRVFDTAKFNQWRIVHYRPALTVDGEYRTALQGDRGAPDLLLARAGRVLLAELKSDTGRYRPGQAEWADPIGPDLYRLWRPGDWGQVLAELATPIQ